MENGKSLKPFTFLILPFTLCAISHEFFPSTLHAIRYTLYIAGKQIHVNFHAGCKLDTVEKYHDALFAFKFFLKYTAQAFKRTILN